jgi:hypothetical protein
MSAVPEHLVVHEVSVDGVEVSQKSRRIDTVAVGLLRRTEYVIHGFEIKVSRSDLLRELADPAKSQAGAQCCDRWWLVIGGAALIRDGDALPENWGLLVPTVHGLRVARGAPRLASTDSAAFRAGLLHAGQRSAGYRRAMGYQAGLQRGRRRLQAHCEDAFRRGYTTGRLSARLDREQAS